MEMTTQPEDGPARKFIDNTLMLYAARFVVPLIGSAAICALTVIGWFATTALADLKKGQENGIAEFKDGQRQVWQQVGKMNDTLSATNAVQSGLSVKIDVVKERVDHLQTQVDGLPRH